MDSRKKIEKRIKKYKHLPLSEMDIVLKTEILSILIDIRDALVNQE